ncbi:MAG: hypothetical protein HYT48_01320 [Candidatus Vogelbacteria bacterium]|nr:hypothetical protein [Candidatus Vogelbacteria bacterium]
MKSGTVSTQTGAEQATDGQLLDIASALVQATPRIISRQRADHLLKDKSKWQEVVRQSLIGQTAGPDDVGRQLESWERHLFEWYRARVDCGKLNVPSLPAEKFVRPRLVVVPGAIKLNEIYVDYSTRFTSYRYADDLDGAHQSSQKRPSGDYVIWTEGAVEPSEALSGSPDELDKRKFTYLVIKERMLLEPKHWEETGGGHLDLENVTITSSRDSDDFAFCAGWDDRQFSVYWWRRDHRHASGRAREAVVNL